MLSVLTFGIKPWFRFARRLLPPGSAECSFPLRPGERLVSPDDEHIVVCPCGCDGVHIDSVWRAVPPPPVMGMRSGLYQPLPDRHEARVHPAPLAPELLAELKEAGRL